MTLDVVDKGQEISNEVNLTPDEVNLMPRIFYLFR